MRFKIKDLMIDIVRQGEVGRAEECGACTDCTRCSECSYCTNCSMCTRKSTCTCSTCTPCWSVSCTLRTRYEGGEDPVSEIAGLRAIQEELSRRIDQVEQRQQEAQARSPEDLEELESRLREALAAVEEARRGQS